MIIGPTPIKQEINKPLSAVENINDSNKLDTKKDTEDLSVTNLTPDELENNLRNLDTVMWSAGIDNSIRAWDIQSMTCRGIFDHDLNQPNSSSEISTLIHIQGTRALITGHHDGKLLWWNTDNASHTKLPHAHTDAVTQIYHYDYNNTEILFRFVNAYKI